jgi:hypothetical protein
MDEALVERIVTQLSLTKPFAELPLMKRPMNTLWNALNRTLLALRMPLYHVYLGKPAPKPKDRTAAIQGGLAFLASFALCTDVGQAIISTRNGHLGSISFQPRPFEFNWTVEHLLSTADNIMHSSGTVVGVEDVLFLAAKVAFAVGDYPYQPSGLPDLTATITFGPGYANVVVRELHGGQTHRATFR